MLECTVRRARCSAAGGSAKAAFMSLMFPFISILQPDAAAMMSARGAPFLRHTLLRQFRRFIPACLLYPRLS